ncbi:Cytochrome P450 [Naviculisporaceae sp. PSN 640]
MATSYLVPAALAILGYFLVSTFRAWYRLRNFPGPFLGSISYLWMAKTSVTGNGPKIWMETQAKYNSPLVRIGPYDLLTGSATFLRHINSARSNYRRDPNYNSYSVDPYNMNMFSTTDEAMHSELKAKTAGAYAGKAVPTLESDIDTQLVALKNMIREKYITTSGSFRPMDMGRVIPWFTLDSITKLAFGKEWGHIKADDDVRNVVGSVDEFARIIALCGEIPPLGRVFFSKFMLRLMGPKDTDPTGVGWVTGLGKRVVAERFDLENPAEKQDMLGSFIRHGISQKQCGAEIILALLAGSETTAGAIRCTIFHILKTPQVYQRLQKEIDQAVQEGKVSRPIISLSEAKSLPYLQAVLYEGIRIQPALALPQTKVAGPGGDTFESQFIPAGTRITVNIFSLMRNKDVFGEDVETFRPERFVEASDKKCVEMEKDVEMYFGHGRYMCAGKMIAFMEMSKAYFELFHDFDMQVVNSCEPWKVQYFTAAKIKDFFVRVTERAQ